MVSLNDRLASAFGGNLIIGWTFMIVMGLILMQIFSYILTQIFGIKQLNLVPALGLIAVGAGLIIAVVAAVSPAQFTGANWMAVFIIAAVVVFIYLLFPHFAPEFGQQAFSTLQVEAMSMLGLG